jgi:hypothetical protein
MSGANYDILAQGLIDKALTANPQTTFWRSTWKRHTRFSIESLSQPFNTTTLFGQEGHVLLNRVGDMVYYLYLHVTLPGIVGCDTSESGACAGLASAGMFPTFDPELVCNPCGDKDNLALEDYLPSDYPSLTESDKAAALKDAKNMWMKEHYGAGTELGCCGEEFDCPKGDAENAGCFDKDEPFAHYVNDIGHFMLQKVKLLIGGQEVDKLWGSFLYAWEELSGKAGRRLTELTGRRYTRNQLICDSREERHLYIPLPFYFTLASGSALPLASLAYHGVQINIDFERIEKLIVVSGPKVAVKNARTGLGMTANDLRADMEITYVYLDQQERDKFSNSHFEQLLVQTQHYSKTENKKVCRIPLSFNHPTQEIIFMVRRSCQERMNNWGNFSGVFGRDPITHAELLLNTTSRFGKKPALYWRAVVPYQHHSNIPESYIYCMSFALSPEMSLEPSGSCNLSRVDNIELVLDMQDSMENESYQVLVFSRSLNLMRFKEGVAGAAFQ